MATKSSTAAITNHDAGTPNQDAILTKAKVVAIPFTTEKVAGNTDGDQIQYASVVMSLATPRMAQRTGGGNVAPPASRAA